MLSMLKRIALSLSLVVAAVAAQETPTEAVEPAAEKSAAKADSAAKDAGAKDAGAKDAEKAEAKPVKSNTVVDAVRKNEQRRVLRPQEVPGELMRLKTKADIKAQLKIRTTSGKPVMFSGVVRNGKLIERIVNRRFEVQKTIAHPRCGVRIWWAGDSDGYIFFRYSSIESIALTGKLTADERAEIMRRLRAKRDGVDPDAAKKAAAHAEAKKLNDFEKMSPAERGKYLMLQFPAAQGWKAKRYAELRRKLVIDNVKLAPKEELFVKYYRELEQVRFHSLRTAVTKKEEFEPGSAESDESEKDSKPYAEGPKEKR